MPAHKVPKINPVEHHVGRNAFDISRTDVNDFAPGILYPVLVEDCLPNDHFSISVTDLIRNRPITSTPFIDAKGVYEFYFVPYSQIWHNFDQFITQQSDYRSRVFSQDTPPIHVPVFGVDPSVGPSCHIGSPAYYLAGLQKKLNSSGGKRDLFHVPTAYGKLVYADLLGYGPIYNGGKLPVPNSSASIVASLNKACTPFRWCALDKIYQDYYRYTSYEKFSVADFNIDNLSTVSSTRANIDNVGGYYYRNYGLDLLTNIRPSPGYNNNGLSFNSDLVPSIPGTTRQPAFTSDGSSVQMTTGLDGTTTTQTTSDLRLMFALDKLGRTIGRTEKDYKSQIKAVFGANVSEGRDGKAIYIGGFDSPLHFTDVNNTAMGFSAGNVYSAYGKVTSSGNGHVEFRAPEYGILMCIYSIIPLARYDSNKISPFVEKIDYADFYNPFFAQLGMQPVNSWNYGVSTNDNNNVVLGYQPRYSEYMAAVDTNHGSFVGSGSNANFTSSRNRGLDNNAFWLHDPNLTMLKVNPGIFNGIFNVNFDGSPQTAPFFGSQSFSIVKVSNMVQSGVVRL